MGENIVSSNPVKYKEADIKSASLGVVQISHVVLLLGERGIFNYIPEASMAFESIGLLV